ncbi:hypothetical protein D6774_01875 [Candidatus Woesearchaeota archaeon]|nr:MAG: hypothetical protein D6774_01875 [Candidatus Woesearchaeota archaeon]
MVLSYHYKVIERPEPLSPERTPSIPVTLANSKGENAIDVVALIDSGSDTCAIPRAFAEILDLDLSAKPEPCGGINGDVEAIPSKMRVKFEKGDEKYQFIVPVNVIKTDYEFGILIGRAGIFNRFSITFDEAKWKIRLKRNQRIL